MQYNNAPRYFRTFERETNSNFVWPRRELQSQASPATPKDSYKVKLKAFSPINNTERFIWFALVLLSEAVYYHRVFRQVKSSKSHRNAAFSGQSSYAPKWQNIKFAARLFFGR